MAIKLTNPIKRPVVFILLGLFLVALIAVILVVVSGLDTEVYKDALNMEKIASYIVLAMGAITGTLLAYRIAHPHKQAPVSALRIFLTVIAFLFGAIPGLLIGFMIMYPLTKHACELSGSKYC